MSEVFDAIEEESLLFRKSIIFISRWTLESDFCALYVKVEFRMLKDYSQDDIEFGEN